MHRVFRWVTQKNEQQKDLCRSSHLEPLTIFTFKCCLYSTTDSTIHQFFIIMKPQISTWVHLNSLLLYSLRKKFLSFFHFAIAISSTTFMKIWGRENRSEYPIYLLVIRLHIFKNFPHLFHTHSSSFLLSLPSLKNCWICKCHRSAWLSSFIHFLPSVLSFSFWAVKISFK